MKAPAEGEEAVLVAGGGGGGEVICFGVGEGKVM